MKKSHRILVTVLLIGVVTLCSVLIANKLFGRLRLDFTEHGIYTLSDGTIDIVSQLNQNLNIKLFYSRTAAIKGPEQIRFYNNYYLYVRELLEEYDSISGGKLKLSVLDPRPFSDEEEEANQFGIRKFQISENENFFFGLAVTSELGKDAVIEFFEPDRQEFVEYDISRLISQIAQREKRKIGVISDLPVMGSDMSPYMMQMMQMQGRQPQQAWNIISHLREEYEVVSIKAEEKNIPSDFDFLMVVHPKALTQQQLYAIDQYVMKGGKLIAFLDPFCISDQPPQNPQNPMASMNYDASSDLNSLLEKWGVKLEKGEFAADRNLAITAQSGMNRQPAPIPTFLQLNNDTVNKDEVITGKLHDLKFLFAGNIVEVEGAGTEVTALLTTTEAGGTWKPNSNFELRMPDPATMLSNIVARDKPVTIAAKITGTFKTNFPGGAPQDIASEQEEDSTPEDDIDDEEPQEIEPSLSESTGDAAVVVFADVDFISDRLAYQQSFFGTALVGDNASLLLNTIDYLSGSGDLISIRSRGKFRRPFDVVDKIETEAEEATAEEVAAINNKISEFRSRLNELGDAANDQNVKLLENAAMSERENIQNEIHSAEKELRRLNAGKRENIEFLGLILQSINMVLAPVAVLIIAVVLGFRRFNKTKRYAARRTQE